jgi:hypothetical protein
VAIRILGEITTQAAHLAFMHRTAGGRAKETTLGRRTYGDRRIGDADIGDIPVGPDAQASGTTSHARETGLPFRAARLLALALAAASCSSASSPSLAWSRVPHDEAVFGDAGDQVFMNDVTAGGPGLVAVGSDNLLGGRAAVWTSPDGITWSRVPHDEAVFGGDGSQIMNGVTAAGPGLVAVGYSGPEEGELDAAVWTSPDGITWSRVPHDEVVFGGKGPVVMNSVTVGGPGLVAVGRAGPMTPQEAVAAVWTSLDGITWSRVHHDEADFGGRGNLFMNSVAAGGPGLVAVGGTHSWQRGDPAPVWTSPDGITWSRVPDDEAVFPGLMEIRSVTAGGPGLVAVGYDSTEESAAVWTSPDGVTWSRVPNDEAVFGGEGDQVMNGVTVSERGLLLVAVGSVMGPESVHSIVWTSPDGISWSRVPRDADAFGPGQVINSVTTAGPGLVAVGYGWVAGAEPYPVAAAWVAASED